MRRLAPALLSALALASPLLASTPASAADGAAAVTRSTRVTTGVCSISAATGASASTVFTPAGATPGDAVDDTPGIQAAIDRAGAAGGGVVPLAAGTYVIDGHLQLRNGVTLQGAGRTTVLKAGPTFLRTKHWFGGYPLITTTQASNVTIKSLTADQSGDVLEGNVPARLTQWLVDVRRSTNVVVDDVHTRNPFSYSIGVVSSQRFCVKNSSTDGPVVGHYNQLDGIHVNTSAFGDVVNNVVDQARSTGGDDGLVAHANFGDVHDIRYVGNKVRGGDRGSGLQLAFSKPGASIYNIYVLSNEFWGARWGGVRTGTYGAGTVKAWNIVIGGPGQGNWFHDNQSDAVRLIGEVSDVTVTDNRACRSGAYSVTGPRVTVAGNENAPNATNC